MESRCEIWMANGSLVLVTTEKLNVFRAEIKRGRRGDGESAEFAHLEALLDRSGRWLLICRQPDGQG